MGLVLTAEDLFDQVKQIPINERIKFFSLVAINAFQGADYTHEQVLATSEMQTFQLKRLQNF